MAGNHTRFAVIFLLLVVTAVGVAAEDDGGYVLGPRDVVNILVYDEPDLERTVTVQSDGTVRFPLIKQWKIGGMTLRDAEKDLETRLGERFLVNAQVTITIKEFHAKKVYVLGDVKEPGLYSLTGRTTVLEIISKAGGVTAAGASRILLVRGAGQRGDQISKLLEEGGVENPDQLREAGVSPPIVIDGHRLFDLGDISQNKTLEDGDIVYVPKVKRVYVLGEVKRPGGVPHTEGLTLLQAISLAGGTTEMASNTIYVTRKGADGKEVRIKNKYSAIVKDTTKDIALEPDDVIVVKRRFL